MKRRQFLNVVACGGVGATAGCLSSDEDTYATLQRVDLINSLDDPVAVEVRIEQEDTDEVAHLDSYEIQTDLRTLDCNWPDEPLMISVRNATADEWNRLTTSDEEGCVSVIAAIDEWGPSFFAHYSECPINSADCHTDATE